MLTLEDIIKTLSPHQEKIPYQSDQLNLEKNFPSYVEEFKNKYMPDETEWQTVPPIPKESFLISVLYLLDSNFPSFNDVTRKEVIHDLRKKMGFQLDEKDLHKKYGYSRKRKFKKVEMQKKLFQVQKCWEDQFQEEPFQNCLQQYLVDFFQINLIILNASDKKVVPIMANLYDPNCWKPTIFVFYEDKRFYPLVTESREKQYYLWSEDEFLKDIYSKFTKARLEPPTNDEEIDNSSDSKCIETIEVDDGEDDDDECENENDDKDENEDVDENDEEIEDTEPEIDLSKLTVKELQKMVTDKGLSIWRTSEKTGKKIFKKKAELMEDLKP